MALREYDPKKVNAVFLGFPVSGYADGTMISIEPGSQDFELYVGSDGEGSRARTNNTSATVTISLAQTSETNQVFSTARQLDLKAPGGGGVGTLFISTQDGNFVAKTAWIQGHPTTTYSRGVEAREWVFETDNMEWFLSGSNVIEPQG